jgi:nucleotide-binding universal stress UspA family protein
MDSHRPIVRGKKEVPDMITIKTVLAATDLSDSSRDATHRAVLLCREHEAKLELLHVLEDLPPLAMLAMDQVLANARVALEEEAGAVVPDGLACQLTVETGKDFVAIVRHARKMMADLIVVGAHGHHVLRDYILGTTAEKLIRKSTLPVLVVKQPPQEAYRRLLVPTDFSEASWQALAAASVIAPKASIDLLHVYGFWGEGRLSMAGAGVEALESYRQQTESSVRAAMDDWLHGIDLAGHHVEQHFRQGHAASVVTQFVAERQHDLVVMGTSGRSGLPYILLGSVTEQALRTLPCDTLTVRPKEFRFELP